MDQISDILSGHSLVWIVLNAYSKSMHWLGFVSMHALYLMWLQIRSFSLCPDGIQKPSKLIRSGIPYVRGRVRGDGMKYMVRGCASFPPHFSTTHTHTHTHTGQHDATVRGRTLTLTLTLTLALIAPNSESL